MEKQIDGELSFDELEHVSGGVTTTEVVDRLMLCVPIVGACWATGMALRGMVS